MRNRIRQAIFAGVGIAALTLGASGMAGATAASPGATLSWDAATSVMSLTITQPGSWELFVNDAGTGGSHVFGNVTGTSGVLTVTVPPFCGTVQGDGLLNGVAIVGKRFKDASCPPPPTTTTTTTTTTTVPPVVTTTVPPVPPVAVVTPAPPVAATPAPPVTATVPMPTVSPVVPQQAVLATTPTSATGAPLPMTGVPVGQLLAIGSSLALLGWMMKRRPKNPVGVTVEGDDHRS